MSSFDSREHTVRIARDEAGVLWLALDRGSLALFSSADEGVSWSAVATDLDGTLGALVALPDGLAIGLDDGVYTSVDGSTWLPFEGLDAAVRHLAVHDGTLHAATSAGLWTLPL